MSKIIDNAIDVFEKQIQALYTNDFEAFLSFMTPRIQKEVTIDIFQKAIDLYKHTPIDIDAVDKEKSRLYSEGESDEIPDRHVQLILVGSGRTLCHVVEIKGIWLIDDIYWRVYDAQEFDTTESSTTEDADLSLLENEEEKEEDIDEESEEEEQEDLDEESEEEEEDLDE